MHGREQLTVVVQTIGVCMSVWVCVGVRVCLCGCVCRCRAYSCVWRVYWEWGKWVWFLQMWNGTTTREQVGARSGVCVCVCVCAAVYELCLWTVSVKIKYYPGSCINPLVWQNILFQIQLKTFLCVRIERKQSKWLQRSFKVVSLSLCLKKQSVSSLPFFLL